MLQRTGLYSLLVRSIDDIFRLSVIIGLSSDTILGDGLRADKAFGSFPDPSSRSSEDKALIHLAPFLRSRILEHGTFGVSHTRVPTESRPGHVAIIAGLYEDVSAVTTGWKLNPVNFDSVFNRSRHTWSWGSPDILPMFEKGAVNGRVDTYMYGAEMEDNSRDGSHLDLWVFDNVREFFASATQNSTLYAALHQDRVVFFLHLLGLDTNGHSYRPYSKEYLNNIKIVDKGVEDMVNLIEGFYADSRTAYIFTADHGMSDWGSHGDGHPDNTRTPLIVWGSGVSGPKTAVSSGCRAGNHDSYSAGWDLSQVARHDVSQADIAPLMAYLIGVEPPANSVGELPLCYVDATPQEKAQAALVNVQTILEIFRVKEQLKRTAEIRYRPYVPFNGKQQSPIERTNFIRELIRAGQFDEAIEESAALLKLGLEGLRYLQTYDWFFLRTLITSGYLGWMFYATTIVIELHVLHSSIAPSRSTASNIFFLSLLAALYASFIASRSPPSYYAYALFPVMFWEAVFARRSALVAGKQVLTNQIRAGSVFNMMIVTSKGLLFLAILLSLVSFSSHHT
jgi:phosphatidylinositol glycan class N